jgi:hypothetical protein
MKPDGNLAFKLTWVYGRRGPFTSACTPEGREVNIAKARRVWCSQKQNDCSKAYASGNSRGPVTSLPCYETAAFREWRFGGGVYHNGARRGQPIPIAFARTGKLAFFTSRPFESSEPERIVLGYFEIAEIESSGGPVWVSGPRGVRISNSSLKTAPRFWKFYEQMGLPHWGCGLFRYMSDEQATRLKHAVDRAAAR